MRSFSYRVQNVDFWPLSKNIYRQVAALRHLPLYVLVYGICMYVYVYVYVYMYIYVYIYIYIYIYIAVED